MSNTEVSIIIYNNNSSYNKYITGYFIDQDSSIKDSEFIIEFPSNSNYAVITLELSAITSLIEFQITFSNSLKLTQFEVDGQESITYDNIVNINTAIATSNITNISGLIEPSENDGVLNEIFISLNVSPINVSGEIIKTQSKLLTETVTKSAFVLVEAGLTLCQIESLKKEKLNQILTNIQSLRNYSRDTGSTTTYNNNGSLNQAGSRYTENFPSAKFANSVGMNELLLNKKKYMFSNSLNKNVVSGPIAFNTLSGYSNTLPYNAGSSGLTKVQQFANAARGRTLSGGPGRRYGVQFYDGRSLVSIPNIYNQTNQTTQTNQTINICAFT
jgi:hypothetical protein